MKALTKNELELQCLGCLSMLQYSASSNLGQVEDVPVPGDDNTSSQASPRISLLGSRSCFALSIPILCKAMTTCTAALPNGTCCPSGMLPSYWLQHASRRVFACEELAAARQESRSLKMSQFTVFRGKSACDRWQLSSSCIKSASTLTSWSAL